MSEFLQILTLLKRLQLCKFLFVVLKVLDECRDTFYRLECKLDRVDIIAILDHIGQRDAQICIADFQSLELGLKLSNLLQVGQLVRDLGSLSFLLKHRVLFLKALMVLRGLRGY